MKMLVGHCNLQASKATTAEIMIDFRALVMFLEHSDYMKLVLLGFNAEMNFKCSYK